MTTQPAELSREQDSTNKDKKEKEEQFNKLASFLENSEMGQMLLLIATMFGAVGNKPEPGQEEELEQHQGKSTPAPATKTPTLADGGCFPPDIQHTPEPTTENERIMKALEQYNDPLYKPLEQDNNPEKPTITAQSLPDITPQQANRGRA